MHTRESVSHAFCGAYNLAWPAQPFTPRALSELSLQVLATHTLMLTPVALLHLRVAGGVVIPPVHEQHCICRKGVAFHLT